MVVLVFGQGIKLSVPVFSNTEVLTANYRVSQAMTLIALSFEFYLVNLPPTAPIPANVCGMAQSKVSVDRESKNYDQPIYTGAWPWVVSLQTAVGGVHFVSSSSIFPISVYTVRVSPFSVAAV